jgi:hypothetical protein
MHRFYEPDLDADPNSPFARDASGKLVRRSYWLDMTDRGIGLFLRGTKVKHMDYDKEIEEQRQRVLEENRRLSNECEYTKDENRRLSNECEKWKRIAIPAVIVVIVGLVMRLLDGNQLNLWPLLGLVCVGLWISFANRTTRT